MSAIATTPTATLPTEVEVAIVGSGFSGLAVAQRLREDGVTDFVMLERADEIGGTWRDNAYPGCACDVPSHLYSLSFAPNPEWSSTFSPQPEILDYLRRVADEQGLREHVRLGCELEEATWDAAACRWRLTTSAGELTARALIAATGPLSEPQIPDLPGLGTFAGRVFHSASWDHEHDLAGERVAVIGTGASAIQFVPEIQPRVGELHVFQRTAPWILPRRARPLTRLERAVYRRFPAAQRAMRTGIYHARELLALPLLDARLARAMRFLGASHINRQVRDPALRAKVTPDYAPGCKRVLISNDYLPALTRPNVDVVTDGIAEIRERSIVTRDGTEREVDTIVFGTGFHVTEPPIARHVRGADGRTLAEHWAGSMQAHRGTTVAGFPNLFFVLGPNTGLGHTSVVVMAEAQATYIGEALRHLRERGLAAIAPRPEAQAAWNAEIQRRMRGTVWTAGGCASWYLDERGRNTTLWPSFTIGFRRLLSRFDAEHYEAVVPAAEPAHVVVG